MLFLVICLRATGTAVGISGSIEHGTASYNASTIIDGNVFMNITNESKHINNTAHSPQTNDLYSRLIENPIYKRYSNDFILGGKKT